MTRTNRRREDETKPARRRQDDHGRRIRPDDPLRRAGRARPGGLSDDDQDDLGDLVDLDDTDAFSSESDDDEPEDGGGTP